MQRDYHHWYSHRLGMEMGVVVYGHYGMPLVGFPTSAGDEWELENQGLIGALSPLIDAGRVKFFTCDKARRSTPNSTSLDKKACGVNGGFSANA